jgi:hypothetical protein
MKLTAKIPNRSSIVHRGYKIKIAPKGKEWPKIQLGEYADESGVYIHISKEQIIYIGKTSKERPIKNLIKKDWATFAERLRREFQETSSQNSRLHEYLKKKRPITTVMFSLEEIDKIILGEKLTLHGKALILEQILIAVFLPTGNRI